MAPTLLSSITPPRNGMKTFGRLCALMTDPYLTPVKRNFGFSMKYTCRLESEFLTKWEPKGTSDTRICTAGHQDERSMVTTVVVQKKKRPALHSSPTWSCRSAPVMFQDVAYSKTMLHHMCVAGDYKRRWASADVVMCNHQLKTAGRVKCSTSS